MKSSVTMSTFTDKDRAFCVEIFFKNGDSVIRTQRAFKIHRGFISIKQCPTRPTILKWVRTFRVKAAARSYPSSTRKKRTRNPDAIKSVKDAITENSRASIRRLAAATSISRSSLQRILRLDLELYPYKIQLGQALKPQDYQTRLEFCETMLAQQELFTNIIFSDEAHFQLHGVVNKQNCRIWASQNPQEIIVTPLHPQKLTVWAGLASWGIVGPYFFQDINGKTINVTTQTYGQLLSSLPGMLAQHDGFNDRTWFQQDGAPPHTANITMATLRAKFPNKLISRRGDINWPPRSPDLSPLDYFLWGYLKDRVYRSKPKTLTELKDNIEREIIAIPKDMLERSIQNFKKRLEECMGRGGQHLKDIIFKK